MNIQGEESENLIKYIEGYRKFENLDYDFEKNGIDYINDIKDLRIYLMVFPKTEHKRKIYKKFNDLNSKSDILELEKIFPNEEFTKDIIKRYISKLRDFKSIEEGLKQFPAKKALIEKQAVKLVKNKSTVEKFYKIFPKSQNKSVKMIDQYEKELEKAKKRGIVGLNTLKYHYEGTSYENEINNLISKKVNEKVEIVESDYAIIKQKVGLLDGNKRKYTGYIIGEIKNKSNDYLNIEVKGTLNLIDVTITKVLFTSKSQKPSPLTDKWYLELPPKSKEPFLCSFYFVTQNMSVDSQYLGVGSYTTLNESNPYDVSFSYYSEEISSSIWKEQNQSIEKMKKDYNNYTSGNYDSMWDRDEEKRKAPDKPVIYNWKEKGVLDDFDKRKKVYYKAREYYIYYDSDRDDPYYTDTGILGYKYFDSYQEALDDILDTLNYYGDNFIDGGKW